MTPLSCAFLIKKVFIIRPNTTYRSSTIAFYYTLQHVSAVQISHHQVDVEKKQKEYKGREAFRYFVMNYYYIIPN
jgi:hypothetical protein